MALQYTAALCPKLIQAGIGACKKKTQKDMNNDTALEAANSGQRFLCEISMVLTLDISQSKNEEM